jgi:acyl-CoA reductase-like NAD-dependent aldehyde dehydrogenase
MSAVLTLPRAVGGYVDGRWVEPADSYPVGNPATETEVGRAPRMTVADALDAAAAARRAFPGWAATPLAERAALLGELSAAIERRSDEFTSLVIAETGALVPFARDVKVRFTVDRFAWHAAATPDWFEERMEVAAPNGGSARRSWPAALPC